MPVIHINLTSAALYMSTLAALRQAVYQARDKGAPRLLTLEFVFPYGGLTMFLKPKDLYLIGFRGDGAVYYFKDASADFGAEIRAAGVLNPNEEAVELGFGGDHTALGTSLIEFGNAMLWRCGMLRDYQKRKYLDSDVKPLLSLLVCMIAEGARFLEMQNRFAGQYKHLGPPQGGTYHNGIFDGGVIRSSGVINCWEKATRAQKFAAAAHVGVSQLSGLVSQLRTALAQVRHDGDRKGALRDVFGGGQGVAHQEARRLLGLLRLTSVPDASELLTLLEDEMVITASRGLLIPVV